jgi:threonine synthase
MVQDGRYTRGPVRHTQSPAMDIQVASNFERLYFEGVERNGVETARAMRAFAEGGVIDIPPRARAMIAALFVGVAVSEDDARRTILAAFNQTGVLIDPHTAVGVAAARRVRSNRATTPMIVLSTAHPAKFPETVKAAAGTAPEPPRVARGLAAKPERIDRLPADAAAVQAYIRDFARG